MTLRLLRQRVWAGVFLFAAVAAAIIVCAKPVPALAHEGHAALPSKGLTVDGNQLLLSQGAREAIDLTTAKVGLADLGRTVECNARVELPWSQQAMVTTQVPGRIADVFVRPGDEVAAGQELARIESLELESLQLAMLQADAEVALARDLFERRSSLAEEGVIAGRVALEAETTLKQRNSDLQIALCKLRAVGLQQQVLDEIRASRRPLASFLISSPIAGTVAHTDVRVGQLVKPTEHLFHVVDTSTLWAIGSVPEGDSAEVRTGQSASVTLTSLSREPVAGTIDHLRLNLDERLRTRAIVMELGNPRRMLRPGMFGRMKIEVAASHEAVVCPRHAIITDRGNHYVLLNRGEGKYVRQPVRLGLRVGNQIEILDGLFPGDQVVTTGNHVLFSLFGSVQGDSKVQTKANNDTRLRQPGTAEPQDSIVAQGVVELPTGRKAFSGARIAGRIGKILVEHSQSVAAGQVLAEVESLELRNVQGELLDTQTKLNWITQRIDLLAPLARQNITSQNELWQLQKDERVFSSKRDSLMRTLSMIGVSDNQIERLRDIDLFSEDCNLVFVRSIPIRAPIDGTVADFDIVPGQAVAAQDTLFEIHDTAKVWVRGHVFQQDAVRVEIGQPARLTFAAYPGFEVTGKVVRLAPVFDPYERVLPLWVEVDNPDGRLIEGMWARIEIEVSSPAADDLPTISTTR